MLRHVLKSDVRQQTVMPKVVVYDHLMFFFCLSVFSAHYLGNNFVYVNWIVELCHYQKKC